MKFRVQLARLVRETKVVEVEAPTREEAEAKLSEVYEEDDGVGFEEDTDWGCDEGTHVILGEVT